MLSKRKQSRTIENVRNRQSGFTIIEVLIVLAIAGLIMVVVFLAVPALQRSQRNNSRKTDADNLLSSISDVASNNGGAFSTSADLTSALNDTKFGYYTTSNITLVTTTSSITTSAPSKDQIFVMPGFTCGTNPTDTPVAATRETAVEYSVETGSGITHQCTSS